MGKRGAGKKEVPTMERIKELVSALVTEEELAAALEEAEGKKHFPSKAAHKDKIRVVGGQLQVAYEALLKQVSFNSSHKTKEQKLEERQLGYALLAKAPEHPVLDRALRMEQVVRESKWGAKC